MSADPCNCWNCKFNKKQMIFFYKDGTWYGDGCHYVSFSRFADQALYGVISEKCYGWQLDPRWYADHLRFIHNGDVEVAL